MEKLWKMRNRKGFTIIELVIIIAVIGILAAVAVPSFVNSQSYVDEQEEKLYDELAKLEVTPNGTPLDAEISAEKVTVDGVSLTDTTVQTGAVATITSSVTVSVDGSVTTDAKYDPYRELIWVSSDPSIANVSNGTVAGYNEGEVIITATSVVDKTKSATCRVTVTAAQPVVTTGGKMSFKCESISGEKCAITGETLEGENHVCNQMSEVTANYCYLKQCGDAYDQNYKYFTDTANLNSDHIPTVKMETDYTGDLTVDYYGVNEDGAEQRVAMILDLNGHTIKGCVYINGIADITSSNGKGKIINTENDTSDGIFIAGSRAENSLYTGKVSNLYIEAKRYGIYVGNGADTKNNGGIWESDIVAGKIGIYVAKKNTANANYRNIYQCNIKAPIGVEFRGNSSEIIEQCRIFATDIGVYLANGANENTSPRVKNTFIDSENVGIKSDYKITIRIGEGNFVWAKNEALVVGDRARIDSNANEGNPSIYYSEDKNGVKLQGSYAKSILTSFYYNYKGGKDTVADAFVGTKNNYIESRETEKWVPEEASNCKVKYTYTVNGVEDKQPQVPTYYTVNFDETNHTLTVTNAGTKSLDNLKYLNVTVNTEIVTKIQ